MLQTDVSVIDWVLLDNPIRVWAIAIVVALGTYLLLGLARSVLLRQLERISRRTHNLWDDIFFRVVEVTRAWARLVAAIWAGSLVLVLSEPAAAAIAMLAVLGVLAQIGIWATAAIGTYVQVYGDRNLQRDAASVTTVRALGFLASVAVWSVVFLVFLENLGIDVTALVAGLGIGGIAVALAAQNILGDLFASLSIVLDKPFVVGDFIVVGDLPGTVERVGLKTTRVRALSGEQLVFSNTDLLGSRIRNFKELQERRIVFAFGVEYGTPLETLRWIPEAVRGAVEAQPDLRFDRAHFKEYGDSSLNFEVVYFVLSPDFNLYMDRQQAINLELYRVLQERGIAFAFPTRTLHVIGDREHPSNSDRRVQPAGRTAGS